MSFNPQDFGITSDVTVANLTHAFTQYEKFVAGLKGETVKAEVPKLESEEDQAEADNYIAELRVSLFSLLDSNPILSTVLADSLQAVVKDTKEFRAWFIADSARKGVEVPQVDGDKESAKAFKELVEMLYGAAKAFKLELPAEFKTKTNKAGDVVPNLSRAPYEKGTATKKVGGYTLRYRWFADAIMDSAGDFIADGIEIPAGTFTDEIAMRYVSTPTYRVERSGVFDALPHRENITPTGQTRRHLDMPKDGSSVFVQFDSGVLEAWLPIGTEEEEDQVDEDSTEEETETE
jgi:hypothetical protein